MTTLRADEFLQPPPKPKSRGRVVRNGEDFNEKTHAAAGERARAMYAEYLAGKHVCTIAFEFGITRDHVDRVLRAQRKLHDEACIQGPAK